MSYPPQQPYQPPAVPGPQQPYQQQPSPPGWQQAPPPWPPPTAPKKRRPLLWLLSIVGGVVGLCLIFGLIGALTNNKDKATSSPQAGATTAAAAKKATTKPAAKKSAGIGTKVRDGKFEFTVTGVDCSKTKVGDDVLNTTAQGKFCIVSVTVANIGDQAQTFDGGDQKAYVGKVEFSDDGTAEMYINSDNQTFLQDINPGNSVKGKLIFDVPKSTKLTEVELHDSPFSGGVRVALA